MFKTVIAAKHPEFSSMRQQVLWTWNHTFLVEELLILIFLCIINCNFGYNFFQIVILTHLFVQDALDFFLHLIDQVDQANTGNHELNPFTGFKFIIEERLQCPSGKVSYNKRSDYILSLNIPLHEATNKGDFKTFFPVVL